MRYAPAKQPRHPDMRQTCRNFALTRVACCATVRRCQRSSVAPLPPSVAHTVNLRPLRKELSHSKCFEIAIFLPTARTRSCSSCAARKCEGGVARDLPWSWGSSLSGHVQLQESPLCTLHACERRWSTLVSRCRACRYACCAVGTPVAPVGTPLALSVRRSAPPSRR